MANKKAGVTGDNLLAILESRLDNVVYQTGIRNSASAEARQLVLHGHFTVNGKKVNIPSYLVKVGDVITIKENSRNSSKIKRCSGHHRVKNRYRSGLTLITNTLTAKVVGEAARDDIDLPIEEHLIVELYSK